MAVCRGGREGTVGCHSTFGRPCKMRWTELGLVYGAGGTVGFGIRHIIAISLYALVI